MAKNDQSSSTDGMSRKERRAAERAARKSGGATSSTTRSSSRSGPSMMVISVGAVIIGLVLVAALIALSGGFGDDEAAAVTTPDEPAPAEDLRVGRSLGDPDAPVIVEAFEDPQCPACGLFTRNIEPLLVAGPVSDGTVLFTYKDFTFLGPESDDAAIAMRAAEALDGKFWDMHQIVFANQSGEGQGAFTEERLADMAVAIGLDREAFLAEIQNPEHREGVEAEGAEGRAAGVNSTPSLSINGELMRGVPQWEDLRSAIETAAEEAQAEA